jgi:Tfp pilus assembly protein FimT
LEIAIVLVVLGIVATLATPTLTRLPQSDELTLPKLVARARSIAVKRAESLELRIDSTGSWALTTERAAGERPIEEGEIAPVTGSSLAIRITPVGLCILERTSDPAAASWDVLRCGPGRAESDR